MPAMQAIYICRFMKLLYILLLQGGSNNERSSIVLRIRLPLWHKSLYPKMEKQVLLKINHDIKQGYKTGPGSSHAAFADSCYLYRLPMTVLRVCDITRVDCTTVTVILIIIFMIFAIMFSNRTMKETTVSFWKSPVCTMPVGCW